MSIAGSLDHHCVLDGCSRSFSTERLLTKHQQDMHGVVPPPVSLPCREPGCERTFATALARALHENEPHSPGEAAPEGAREEKNMAEEFTCTDCGHPAKNAAGLAIHRGRAHGAKKDDPGPIGTEEVAPKKSRKSGKSRKPKARPRAEEPETTLPDVPLIPLNSDDADLVSIWVSPGDIDVLEAIAFIEHTNLEAEIESAVRARAEQLRTDRRVQTLVALRVAS